MRHPDLIRASWPAGDRARCIHESAHGVIAAILHVPFACIEIGDRLPDGTDGSFSRGRIRFADGPASARDHVVVALAGGEGARKAYGFIEPGTDQRDIQHARDILADALNVPRSDVLVDDMLDHLRSETADLIKDHWPAILAVESWLRRERLLTADRIKEICAACAPSKGPNP